MVESKGEAPPSVFISYSSADLTWARRVHDHLEAAGVSCWLAPRAIQAGDDWARRITEAITHATSFVLIFSAASSDSPHVRREVHLAAEHGVRLIPLRLEACAAKESLAYFLAGVHWIDWDERTDADGTRVLEKVEQSVEHQDRGILLPAPPPSKWRLAAELGLALLLTGCAAWLLLPGNSGEPVLTDGRGRGVALLGTCLGLGLFMAVRHRQIRRPHAPVVGAVGFYFLASMLLAALYVFYGEVVLEWQPSQEEVATLLAQEDESPIEDSALAQVEGPVHLEHRGSSYYGLVLVPPLSWLTEDTQDYLQFRHSPENALDVEGVWLITEYLDREKSAIRITTLIIAGLYLLSLGSLSAAHAFALTAIERRRTRGSWVSREGAASRTKPR